MATWGNTNIEATGIALTTPRYGSGEFDEGTNGVLDSIVFYVAAGATLDARICIYEGTSTVPDGDDLLEDLGVAANVVVGWNTILSSTNPPLTVGKFYALCMKSDDATINGRSSSSLASVLKKRGVLGNESADETNPWDDPCSNNTGNANGAPSIYLNYTAAGGLSIPIASYHYRHHIGV